MKIGAMDNVLAKPWAELFDEAARLGFDGVELDLRPATYLESERRRISKVRSGAMKDAAP
jgi:sugar phosphate isomerase/epimerase